jgi:sporulation integral membrane protein YlbJ
MLPFFFFTSILTMLGLGSTVCKIFKKPMSLLYNTPPVSGYIFFIGLISGYPVGAKLTSDMYQKGVITEKEAVTISSFCSTASPIFVVSSVGAGLFKDVKLGYIILFAQIIGAILNGLIYRGKKTDNLPKTLYTESKNYDNLLREAIYSAIISVLIVGGFVSIFSMLIIILKDIYIIDFISLLFSYPLKLFKINPEISYPLAISFIEMTQGCKAISLIDINKRLLVAFTAFMVSFGGLSVTLQNLTYMSNYHLKPSKYFLMKFTQALIAFFVAGLLS